MGAESDGGQGSLTPVGRSHRVSSKLSHNQFKMNRLVIKKIMDCYGPNITNENYDIAIAMSSSRADPVLGHCPGWGYLNI